MKKLLAILLASVMTATALVGCSDKPSEDLSGANTEVVTYDNEALAKVHALITETVGAEDPNNTIVMNIGNYPLTLAEYEYMYLTYLNNSLQYTLYYGFDVLKDENFRTQMADMFNSEIKTAAVILKMANDKGITLTEDEINESIKTYYDEMKTEYGEEFESTFQQTGIPSLNSILYYDYIFALYDKILEGYSLSAEDVEAALADSYIRAKHILVTFPTNEDGSEVTDEQKAEAYAKAEEIMTKINDGADFDELIAEYNEDPGMETNTDGYYFTTGEMVEPFETAAFALEDNAVSDIVETTYGYHIIKRLPVDDEFKATTTYTTTYDNYNSNYSSELFYNDMQTVADSLERVDVENFDELVAPVVAEAEEKFAEYELQFNAMYGLNDSETETEEEFSGEETTDEETAETDETETTDDVVADENVADEETDDNVTETTDTLESTED